MKEKILSNLQNEENKYIIPPNSSIIVKNNNVTKSGLILTGVSNDSMEVVAIGKYVETVSVGEQVKISFSRYYREVPSKTGAGMDVVNAFPKERILMINKIEYFIMYSDDILYIIADNGTVTSK
jgi:hypothetical protein